MRTITDSRFTYLLFLLFALSPAHRAVELAATSLTRWFAACLGGNRMTVNLDAYYRGLAAEELQQLGDRLMLLSGEAEAAGASDAAWHLSELATELLDMGLGVGNQRTPRTDL
jgi:hypothetical protein